MDRDLYERLQQVASKRQTTVQELCLSAICREVAGEGLSPDQSLTELWDNEEDAVYDNL